MRGRDLVINVAEYDEQWQQQAGTSFKMPNSMFNPHDFAFTSRHHIFFQVGHWCPSCHLCWLLMSQHVQAWYKHAIRLCVCQTCSKGRCCSALHGQCSTCVDQFLHCLQTDITAISNGTKCLMHTPKQSQRTQLNLTTSMSALSL